MEQPVYSNANTDLFINLGKFKRNLDCYLPGVFYLRGPATSAQFCNYSADNLYIGIRFKPGGLRSFYQISLSQIVDQTQKFHDKNLRLILSDDESLPLRLDKYFLEKKKKTDSSTMVTDTVYRSKGQISVDQLAKTCYVSNRTLERYCYLNLGIGPKEFINIVRFKHVVETLENQKSRELGRTAVGMGYYDQSHFIKEIKKRTGLVPSCIFPIPQFP